MKAIIIIILMGISGYLGYLLFDSLQEPILQEAVRSKRKDATVAKLKTIRAAQIAYRNNNQKYASTFDSLVMYVKTGNYMLLTKIGDPNDTTKATRIDTTLIPVIDSLFKGNTRMLDTLINVPYTDGVKFAFTAGDIIKNETPIPAFEAKVRYGDLYSGLIEKYFKSKKDKYLQVGSMQDATTTGNWEK